MSDNEEKEEKFNIIINEILECDTLLEDMILNIVNY